MKKAVLFLLLFSFVGLTKAQLSINQYDNNQCTKVESAMGWPMSIDPNGNVYLVNGPILYKFNPAGELVGKYSNYLLGDIRSIDTDNPLKIMVFYYNESKIVFLNEKLTPLMEPLDLRSKNYMAVTLATYSTDNTIWIYDAVLHDLINLDFHLRELSRSHLSMDDLHPNQLISLQEKQLVMNNPETGVIFFDAFGTYLKTIPIQSPTHTIQVDASSIYYIKKIEDKNYIDGSSTLPALYRYDYKNLDNQEVAVFSTNIMQVEMTASRMYFIDNNLNLHFVTLP